MAGSEVQLHDWIHQVGMVAFNYGIQQRSKDAGDLGVRLCLVSGALKDAELDRLAEQEIRELSEVISELESISKVPQIFFIPGPLGLTEHPKW